MRAIRRDIASRCLAGPSDCGPTVRKLIDVPANADSVPPATGWGIDQIWDFEDGVDKIDITQVAGLNTFAQFNLQSVAAGTFVHFGWDTLFLHGIAIGNVAAGDFDL